MYYSHTEKRGPCFPVLVFFFRALGCEQSLRVLFSRDARSRDCFVANATFQNCPKCSERSQDCAFECDQRGSRVIAMLRFYTKGEDGSEWRWDTNLIDHIDDEDGNTYEILSRNDMIIFTCKAFCDPFTGRAVTQPVMLWRVILVVQDNLTMNGYFQCAGRWPCVPLGCADLFGVEHDFQRTFAQKLYTRLPYSIPGYNSLDFHFDLHYVM